MVFPVASSISERIAQIRQTLPDSVRLIAVTKQVSPEAMRAAYNAGVRDFGESRIQEAEWKKAELSDLSDVVWHMIGRLQSNKAQKALQLFQWIQSVDSLKLAQRLDRLAASLDQKPNICIQVKMLPDPSKGGWPVADLLNELPALNECSALNIRGLMMIPPLGLSATDLLTVFQETRQLATEIQAKDWPRIPMQELSMGMSGDYSVAIQAGATMVRLGRILFGDRET